MHRSAAAPRVGAAALVAVGGLVACSGGAERAAQQADSSTPAPLPTPVPRRLGSDRSSGVELNAPRALAIAADGSVLIANAGSHQVLRRPPEGGLEVLAGNGTAGSSGDGGPAVDAALDTPSGLAVGPDGTLYIADSGAQRVRAVATDGIITTIAGTGKAATRGDGGPATAAALMYPSAVAASPDRKLFIAEADRIRRVGDDGTITTAVQGGPVALAIDAQWTTFLPSAIAVNGAGYLVASGLSPKLLAVFGPDGQLRNVEHSVYVTPAGLATAPDGTVVIADYGQFSIRRLAGATLTTVVAFNPGSVPDLTGGFRPSGVAVGADGTIYATTDGRNGGGSGPALIAIDATGRVRTLAVGSPTSPAR